MNKQRGFTLIEIMITIAIVAILSAIAIPQYQDFVVRGELVEAHSGLAAYRVKQEQWYQDNRNYGSGGCGSPVTGPNAPVFKNWTLTCTGGGENYVAKMTGSSGRVTGWEFTINEANVRQTTVAPTGWAPSLPYPCFITRKGSC